MRRRCSIACIEWCDVTDLVGPGGDVPAIVPVACYALSFRFRCASTLGCVEAAVPLTPKPLYRFGRRALIFGDKCPIAQETLQDVELVLKVPDQRIAQDSARVRFIGACAMPTLQSAHFIAFMTYETLR